MKIFLFTLLFLAVQSLYGQNSRGQLLPYKENYKWGYINFSGETVIPARFDMAGNFEGEFAVVKAEGKSGMISSSGKQLIPCMYSNVNILSKNQIAVREKELWGLVDSLNTPILPQEYESLEWLNLYTIKLKKNSRYGLYHAISGKLLACAYDTLTQASYGFFVLNQKGQNGMADSALNVVIEPAYDYIKVERAALVFRKNGLWGAFSKSGKMGTEALWKNYKVVSSTFLMFQDSQANLWALYSSEENRIVTKTEYNDFDFLTEDLVVTTVNKKKGMIRKNGKILIEPLYDDYQVKKYLIYIKSDNKWGLADLNGKLIHEPAWRLIGEFKDNLAVISSAETGLWGLINTKGKILVEPKYSNFEFTDMAVKCYVNDRMDMVSYDEQGNLLDIVTYKNVKTLQVGGYQYTPPINTNATRRISNQDTFSLILRVQPYRYPSNVRSRTPIPGNIKEIYARYGMFDRTKKMLVVKTEKWDLMLDDFRSGPMARIIEEGGRFGLMDRRGVTKMDFTILKKGKAAREKISYIGEFSEDLARINLGGALTSQGSPSLPNRYMSLRFYSVG
ncbi:MAG: WG repeat-containing protein, partial [Cytophagaceae bacterium]